MLMESKTVLIPAQTELDADQDDPTYEGLSTTTHAAFGAAAVEAGTPDYGANGDDADGIATDASDAIAAILHWVDDRGGDPDLALSRARMHYDAERS